MGATGKECGETKIMKSEPIYGLFYKNKNGKWCGPAHGELITKQDIIWSSDLPESSPDWMHLSRFLKAARKQKRRQVQLCQQGWRAVYSI